MNLSEQDISRMFQAHASGLSSEAMADILHNGKTMGVAEAESFDQTDLAALRLSNELEPWADQLAEGLEELQQRKSWLDHFVAWLSPSGEGSLGRMVPMGAAAALVLTVAVVTQYGPTAPVAGSSPVASTSTDVVLFDASFESVASVDLISQSGFEATTSDQAPPRVLFEGGFESADEVFSGSFEAVRT